MGNIIKANSRCHVLLDLEDEDATNLLGYSTHLTRKELLKIIEMSLNTIRYYDSKDINDDAVHRANKLLIDKANNK